MIDFSYKRIIKLLKKQLNFDSPELIKLAYIQTVKKTILVDNLWPILKTKF
jgi:hypothetical protein